MAGVNLILFTKPSTHIQFHYIASTCTGGSLISWPAEVFLRAPGKKTCAFTEEQWMQNLPVTGAFVSHWLVSSKTTKSWFSQSEETYFAFTRQHRPSIAVKVITYVSLKHNINKLSFKYNFPNVLQRLQKISHLRTHHCTSSAASCQKVPHWRKYKITKHIYYSLFNTTA